MTDPSFLERAAALVCDNHRTHTRQPSATNEPRRTFHQGQYDAVRAIVGLIQADPSAIVDGPRPDAYHNHELPEHQWSTCRGCLAFRVHDFHYWYCRRLGNQAKPDRWPDGWFSIYPTHNEEKPAPCGLPTVFPLPMADAA